MELKTYVAQDATGQVIPGATATLLINGTDTPVPNVFDKNDQIINNPMTADANGVINFKAANGIYQLQFALGPLVGPRFTVQLIDLVQQLADANSAVAQASDFYERMNSIVAGKIYGTITEAMNDPTLLANQYFAMPAAAASQIGAFTYFQKGSQPGAYQQITTIPTAAQVSAMQLSLESKMGAAKFDAVIQTSDPNGQGTDLLYCVRDSKGFQTWLGVRLSDGGPSAQAERLIRQRLGVITRTNFLADGEEIAWAVTDSAGILTDLAIRAKDGLLADYAVKRIGTRILGTIQTQLFAQIDGMQVPRDATGFQVLASICRWGAARGRGESLTGPINFVTPTNTQNARLTFPSPYNNDGPMLMVIYFGGVGSSATLTPPTEYAAANNDGIIWARCNFSGDHYGSPSCMADVADLYAQACKLAPIGGVVLLGNSMGGMGALNALLTKAVPGVLGLYLTDPVANLFDRYNSTRQGLIQTAYGINANGDNYSTKTAGYDPVLRNWTDFKGVPVYCIASTGDDQVPFATNAKQLYDTFAGHLDFTLIDKGSAGHNAADRFDPVALRAFLRKCAGGNILKA